MLRLYLTLFLFSLMYGNMHTEDFNLKKFMGKWFVISHIPNFIERALANKNLYITGTGEETRDFTYIDDAIKIIFNTLKSKKKISIINSCTGKKTKITNLAKKIIKFTNSKSKIVVINKLRKWDKIKNRTGNIDNTLKVINKKSFTEIDIGLKKTIDWYRYINY